MAVKEYISLRWPNLHIPGIGVKFRAGSFSTDDEDVQKDIERQHSFGDTIIEAGAPRKGKVAAELDEAIADVDVPPGESEAGGLPKRARGKAGVKKGHVVHGMVGTGDSENE